MSTGDLPAPTDAGAEPVPFIDLHVAQRIAERAANDSLRQLRFLLWAVVSIITLGCIAEFAGLHFGSYMTVPYFYYLALPVFFGAYASSQESLKVQQALAKGDLDEVSIICPRAAVWNYMWCPVTLKQYQNCLLAEERMLIAEGRYIELEAMLRYLWAQSEQRAVSIGIPQDVFIATHLVMSLMEQQRYAEAALILQKQLDLAKQKDKLRIECQLALCYAHLGRFDDADNLIQDCRQEGRVVYLADQFTLTLAECMIQLERADLDECEESAQKCLKLCQKVDLTGDFQPSYNRLIGKIRAKQERYEEAELNFRNALDLAQSAANPDLLSIKDILNDFATVLAKAGKPELANEKTAQANRVRDIYARRERRAISAILTRLDNKQNIWVAPQILSTERRRNLLGERLS